MKKADVINLIKYHYEMDSVSFYNLSFEIAKEFETNGDGVLAQYIESILSKRFTFVPQSFSEEQFFEEISLKMKNPIYLPDPIKDDLFGILNSLENYKGINKFLFIGSPGTGKTESVKFLASKLKRKIYNINFNSLIDSKLGETLKNIDKMFSVINNVSDLSRYIFLFDEIDVIALDRINSRDVREMGRATSLFIKNIDNLSNDAIVFATTNLENDLDRAVKRRFDYIVSFDRYTKKDLSDIAIDIIKEMKETPNNPGDFTLIRKLIEKTNRSLSPAELRNDIRISLAFAKNDDNNDFIKRLFVRLFPEIDYLNFPTLRENLDLTLREIEKISGVSKSTIARSLNEGEQV